MIPLNKSFVIPNGAALFLWQLSTSFDLELAAVALRQHNISIVICESHLPSGTWRHFLGVIYRL